MAKQAPWAGSCSEGRRCPAVLESRRGQAAASGTLGRAQSPGSTRGSVPAPPGAHELMAPAALATLYPPTQQTRWSGGIAMTSRRPHSHVRRTARARTPRAREPPGTLRVVQEPRRAGCFKGARLRAQHLRAADQRGSPGRSAPVPRASFPSFGRCSVGGASETLRHGWLLRPVKEAREAMPPLWDGSGVPPATRRRPRLDLATGPRCDGGARPLLLYLEQKGEPMVGKEAS